MTVGQEWWWVLQGDCKVVLQGCSDQYFDAMVTDPPAGIEFMGREWDSNKGGRDAWIEWLAGVMQECYRVLKPGAHAFVWALPRTSSWTCRALEDAGFEVRHIVHHLHGTGFPKSQDVGKFIDKLAGAEREVVGTRPKSTALGTNDLMRANGLKTGMANYAPVAGTVRYETVDLPVTVPATEAAQTWDGWGTALKSATEHWILVRKPLSESSIARNVLRWGTGALNIDACRVERASDDVPGWHESGAKGSSGYQGEETFKIRDMSPEEIQERCGDKGRWPPDLILSHAPDCGVTCVAGCPVAELDRQGGVRTSGARKAGYEHGMGYQGGHGRSVEAREASSGGASRFFPTFHYFAKPSRSEREAGLDDLPSRILNRVNPGGLENEPRFAPVAVKNNHPTVKGIALMTWLIQLITPPGGIILDPFCGSGSTGAAAVKNGFQFVGIDQDESYCAIARARIRYWDVKRLCEP